MSPSEVFWLVAVMACTSTATAILSYQLGYAHGRLREMEEQRELDERPGDAPAYAPASAPPRPRGPEWI